MYNTSRVTHQKGSIKLAGGQSADVWYCQLFIQILSRAIQENRQATQALKVLVEVVVVLVIDTPLST